MLGERESRKERKKKGSNIRKGWLWGREEAEIRLQISIQLKEKSILVL